MNFQGSIKDAILAQFVVFHPEPIEAFETFLFFYGCGRFDEMNLGEAICRYTDAVRELEHEGYVRALVKTPGEHWYMLTDEGRQHLEACLPDGMDLADFLSQMVADLLAGKAATA